MRSIDGRRFRDITKEHNGDVDGETTFDYHEDDDETIWASYAGGGVRRGFLVGNRAGSTLDFRYAHITHRGETASGHCTSRIEELTDGRLRMHETWSWESKAGSGTSLIEEVARDG